MKREHYLIKDKYKHISGLKLTLLARNLEKKTKGKGISLLTQTILGIKKNLIREVLIGNKALVGNEVVFPIIEIRKTKNGEKRNKRSTNENPPNGGDT